MRSLNLEELKQLLSAVEREIELLPPVRFVEALSDVAYSFRFCSNQRLIGSFHFPSRHLLRRAGSVRGHREGLAGSPFEIRLGRPLRESVRNFLCLHSS